MYVSFCETILIIVGEKKDNFVIIIFTYGIRVKNIKNKRRALIAV